MPHLVHENTARLVERSGSQWAIRVITPGQGSSGIYTEEILARDAATAFPKGTKLWFKHPGEGEGAGDRDPRDQWGVLTEDAYWSSEHSAVVSSVRVLDHWATVVNSLGTEASLSIYAWAERDDEDVISALMPHRTNSIDIVSYPGRPGSGLAQQIEAAREAAPKPTAEASAGEKEGSMKPEEIQAVAEALASAVAGTLAPVLDFVNESKSSKDAEAQAKVDAEALESASKDAVGAYKSAVEKIDAAELLAPLAEGLKARAEKGEEVTEAEITAAKEQSTALIDAAKERITDEDEGSHGRVFESATGDVSTLTPKAWS